MTERTVIRAERLAKAIDLLGGECVKCGATDKLHFDHTKNDREDLLHTVANLLGGSWGRVLLELEKCQLLCPNCHARKTHRESGHHEFAVHGSASMYNNEQCRCDKCREAWAQYTQLRRPSRAKHKLDFEVV